MITSNIYGMEQVKMILVYSIKEKMGLISNIQHKIYGAEEYISLKVQNTVLIFHLIMETISKACFMQMSISVG